MWRGETTAENGDAYESHLTETVFPALARLEGHLGGHILRRSVGDGMEFLVVTLWTSTDAVRAFAGDDIERAVVEPAAAAVLRAHDDFVRHFDVTRSAHIDREGQDRAVPILPVRSIRAAVAHYATLGFDTSIHDDELAEPTYAFAVRNGVEIHFTRVPDLDPKTSASACYLHVEDAASMHEQWTSSGAAGRFTAIEAKPWGKYEFAHVDPDGNLVRVGSPLRRS